MTSYNYKISSSEMNKVMMEINPHLLTLFETGV